MSGVSKFDKDEFIGKRMLERDLLDEFIENGKNSVFDLKKEYRLEACDSLENPGGLFLKFRQDSMICVIDAFKLTAKGFSVLESKPRDSDNGITYCDVLYTPNNNIEQQLLD